VKRIFLRFISIDAKVILKWIVLKQTVNAYHTWLSINPVVRSYEYGIKVCFRKA